MKKHLIVALTCLLPAGAALPQGDPIAMEKWTKQKTIFYHVDGAFSGKALISDPNGGAWADVTDRVVMDLEWDLINMKLVGVLKLQNFPTKTANVRQSEPKCAPPVPRGPYEHWTVLGLADGLSGQAEMKVETTIPDVDVPQFCTGKLKLYKGKKTVRPEEFSILSPVFFTMPLAPSAGMAVSADKKSLISKKNGWTWTFTPSLTKTSM